MKRYIRSGKWVRSGYDSFIKFGDKFYWTSEENSTAAQDVVANYVPEITNRPFCLARYPDESRSILNHHYGWSDEQIARTVFFIYDMPSNRELWGITDDNIIDVRTE